MKYHVLVLAVAAILSAGAASAQTAAPSGAPAANTTSAATPSGVLTTGDTPIGTLLDNPAARAMVAETALKLLVTAFSIVVVASAGEERKGSLIA